MIIVWNIFIFALCCEERLFLFPSDRITLLELTNQVALLKYLSYALKVKNTEVKNIFLTFKHSHMYGGMLLLYHPLLWLVIGWKSQGWRMLHDYFCSFRELNKPQSKVMAFLTNKAVLFHLAKAKRSILGEQRAVLLLACCENFYLMNSLWQMAINLCYCM